MSQTLYIPFQFVNVSYCKGPLSLGNDTRQRRAGEEDRVMREVGGWR